MLDQQDSDEFDFDEFLSDEVDFLTSKGNMFYPFSESNFIECEEAFADKPELYLTYRITLASDPAEAGSLKANFCIEYMAAKAKSFAVHEYEHEREA